MMSIITTLPERETAQIYVHDRGEQILHQRSTLQPFWRWNLPNHYTSVPTHLALYISNSYIPLRVDNIEAVVHPQSISGLRRNVIPIMGHKETNWRELESRMYIWRKLT
jgi:hypothetical protein